MRKLGVYRIKKVPGYRCENHTGVVIGHPSLKGKSYYEIAELSSVPQAFPFEYTVSLEWLHDSDLFTLSNFGGKIVLTVD